MATEIQQVCFNCKYFISDITYVMGNGKCQRFNTDTTETDGCDQWVSYLEEETSGDE